MTVGAAVALLAVGLIWGLATSFAESPSPASDGKVVLKVGLTNMPDSLNPFVGVMSGSYEIWSMNYDLMVGFNPTDYAHPMGLTEANGLAYEWSSTPDGKVWTFKIRTGVKWQDGEPLTARDVAFSYNYIIDNDLTNYTMYMNFIEKVEATDDETVVFTCSKPKANMLSLWVYIVPEHIWSKIPGKAAGGGFQNKPPVVGSGPFQLVEFKKDVIARMAANKDYWGGAPKIDEVDFLYYTNADSMAQELNAGTIQAADGLLEAEFRTLQNSDDIKPLSYVTLSLDELGFNCYNGKSLGHPVLKDWKFRQALQWAVDHDKLVQIAYGGHAQPATSILVSNFWKDPDWHWEPPAETKYTFDLDKANAALDAAGYKDTNGDGIRDYKGEPIELRLWALSSSAAYQSAGKLIAGWFKDCGLKIKLTIMDEGAVMDGQYNMEGDTFVPDYDMFLWGWGGDPDPNFMLSNFITDQINSWSDCAWSNAEYDKLFLEQQTTIDPVKRKEITDRMQEMIYEQTPYIPTVYPDSMQGYDAAKWRGWVHTPAPDGGVFFMSPVAASYQVVEPASAVKSEDGVNWTVTAIVIAAAAAVVIIVVVVLMRRKPKVMEE